MKIAHVTTVHRAHDARIFERECRSLAAAGHDVLLICPHDRIEQVEGVTIHPLVGVKRRQIRMTLGVYRAYATARRCSAEVYHLHDPELLPLAPLLKRKAKVVFDAHEDLPAQVLTKAWLPRWLRGVVAGGVARSLPFLVRGTDAVVAATPAIADTIRTVPVTTVQNYPRPTRVGPATPFEERDTAVAYIGGLSQARGAEELVEALRLLPPTSKATLRCAGVFESERLQERLVRHEGWKKVRFEGWLSRDDVGRLLAGCRAGVVTLLPAPNYLQSQPLKLFEYMAAGLPVIASDFPLWREIVTRDRCGVLVDPRDPGAIASAIDELTSHPDMAEEMGDRGRAAVERSYNWKTQERILLQLYEELACASGS